MNDIFIERISSELYLRKFSHNSTSETTESVNITQNRNIIQISIVFENLGTMIYNVNKFDWYKIQEQILTRLTKKDIYKLKVVLHILQPQEGQLKQQLDNVDTIIQSNDNIVTSVNIPPQILLWVLKNHY